MGLCQRALAMRDIFREAGEFSGGFGFAATGQIVRAGGSMAGACNK
jgi:hypothetical protein